MKNIYIYDLPEPHYRKYVSSVRAFYDAMYVHFVKYCIKKGIKDIRKKTISKKYISRIPDWRKNSWYRMYDIKGQIYELFHNPSVTLK